MDLSSYGKGGKGTTSMEQARAQEALRVKNQAKKEMEARAAAAKAAPPSAPREVSTAASGYLSNAAKTSGVTAPAASAQSPATSTQAQPEMTTYSNEPPSIVGEGAQEVPSSTVEQDRINFMRESGRSNLSAIKESGNIPSPVEDVVLPSEISSGPRKDVGPAGPISGAGDTLNQAVAAGAIPSTNEQLDQQIRSLLGDLVGGRGMNVDTAKEEALVKELMQDRLGAGLVEQRARMGRAGFGASGALAAMEGDIRRQAGQQATQETLALRRQAEQEAIQNALNAIGVDVTKRKEARQEAFDQEFLNALKSALGMETPPVEGGSPAEGLAGPAQAAMDLANATILHGGAGDAKDVARSGAGEDTGKYADNPIMVDAPPPGATETGNPGLYLGKNGLYYRVRA